MVLVIGLVMVKVQRIAEPQLHDALADNPEGDIGRYMTQVALDAGHAALEAARPTGLVWNALTASGAIHATNAILGVLRLGNNPSGSTTADQRNKPEWLTPESEELMMRIAKEKFRMDITPVELWGRYWQLAEQMGGGPPGDLTTDDINRKTGT
jgi:hypothetical protein